MLFVFFFGFLVFSCELRRGASTTSQRDVTGEEANELPSRFVDLSGEHRDLRNCKNSAENRANPHGLNAFWRQSLQKKWKEIKSASVAETRVFNVVGQEEFETLWDNWEPRLLQTEWRSQQAREVPKAGVYSLGTGRVAKWYEFFSNRYLEGFLLGECLGGPEIHGVYRIFDERDPRKDQYVTIMNDVKPGSGYVNSKFAFELEGLRESVLALPLFTNWIFDLAWIAFQNRIEAGDFQFLIPSIGLLKVPVPVQGFQIVDTDLFHQLEEEDLQDKRTLTWFKDLVMNSVSSQYFLEEMQDMPPGTQLHFSELLKRAREKSPVFLKFVCAEINKLRKGRCAEFLALPQGRNP